MRTTSKQLKSRINDLFLSHPEAKLTENRYRAIRNVLLDKYPFLNNHSVEMVMELLHDADLVGRTMRRMTEGDQKAIKQILSQEFVVQEYMK
jgi:hypothetical protein